MPLADLAVPFVRMLPAEAAHNVVISALKNGLGVPRKAKTDELELAVTLPKSGLKLSNPIGLAAGFDKNCEVPAAMARFGFGWVECGTVTPRPQPGNPRPRLFRLSEDKAVINRMGFNNFGLEYFTRRLARYQGGVPIGANVGANKTSHDRSADYVEGIGMTTPYADYITLNISSPNTPGLRGLQDKAALEDLLMRCSMAISASEKEPPVFLKLAPDLDEEAITDIAGVLKNQGAWLSGLIVSNTTIARPSTLQSGHRKEAGGLSGGPLFAPSTAVLAQFARALDGQFDLIGVGGIASGADVYAKICAGAHAVQLYTALIYAGPGLATRIKRELCDCLEAGGFNSVSEAVGSDI